MKAVLSIYVHLKADNSYCNGDFKGHLYFDSEDEAMKFLNEKKFGDITNKYYYKVDDCMIIYLKDIEYNRRRNEVEEFFVKGRSDSETGFWDLVKERNNALRAKKGYVYCKKYDEMTNEDYYGSLGSLLEVETLKKYIDSKYPAGYVGHSNRKHIHDEVFLEIVEDFEVTTGKVTLKELIAGWMDCSGARHFMDNVDEEDYPTKESFKEKILTNIDYLCTYANECYGYTSEKFKVVKKNKTDKQAEFF